MVEELFSIRLPARQAHMFKQRVIPGTPLSMKS